TAEGVPERDVEYLTLLRFCVQEHGLFIQPTPRAGSRRCGLCSVVETLTSPCTDVAPAMQHCALPSAGAAARSCRALPRVHHRPAGCGAARPQAWKGPSGCVRAPLRTTR